LIKIITDGYSLTEAAKKCAVHRVTLWRWIKSKQLTAYRTTTGQYRIKKKDLEDFIEERLKSFNLDEQENKKKILIIDDDPGFRKLVRKIVQELDLQPLEAATALEAGAKIAQTKPSLIILDLYMPGVDGFEACRIIRSDLKNNNIKILAVTGKGTPEVEEKIRELGADDFLRKPLGKKELINRIQMLLQKESL